MGATYLEQCSDVMREGRDETQLSKFDYTDQVSCSTEEMNDVCIQIAYQA